MLQGIKTRHDYSLEFLRSHTKGDEMILDLGFVNDLSCKMKRLGFFVYNTRYDLDLDPDRLELESYDVVTAFEILEHLIEPAQVLKRLSGMLLASVPVDVWFSPAHWTANPYEQHYHEFYPQQFDKLLYHCGWEIIEKKKARIVKRIGIRQALSVLFPRYYFVYVQKTRRGK